MGNQAALARAVGGRRRAVGQQGRPAREPTAGGPPHRVAGSRHASHVTMVGRHDRRPARGCSDVQTSCHLGGRRARRRGRGSVGRQPGCGGQQQAGRRRHHRPRNDLGDCRRSRSGRDPDRRGSPGRADVRERRHVDRGAGGLRGGVLTGDRACDRALHQGRGRGRGRRAVGRARRRRCRRDRSDPGQARARLGQARPGAEAGPGPDPRPAAHAGRAGVRPAVHHRGPGPAVPVDREPGEGRPRHGPAGARHSGSGPGGRACGQGQSPGRSRGGRGDRHRRRAPAPAAHRPRPGRPGRGPARRGAGPARAGDAAAPGRWPDCGSAGCGGRSHRCRDSGARGRGDSCPAGRGGHRHGAGRPGPGPSGPRGAHRAGRPAVRGRACCGAARRDCCPEQAGPAEPIRRPTSSAPRAPSCRKAKADLAALRGTGGKAAAAAESSVAAAESRLRAPPRPAARDRCLLREPMSGEPRPTWQSSASGGLRRAGPTWPSPASGFRWRPNSCVSPVASPTGWSCERRHRARSPAC